jgi:trigger factor
VLKSETDKMLAQIEADVARSGASLDDYLKHIQKTKEELMQEFAPEAEKRARFQLVLNAIARDAKVLPTEAEVEAEAQKYMAMYPTADPNRTRAYADMMLTNDKVLSMLEGK